MICGSPIASAPICAHGLPWTATYTPAAAAVALLARVALTPALHGAAALTPALRGKPSTRPN